MTAFAGVRIICMTTEGGDRKGPQKKVAERGGRRKREEKKGAENKKSADTLYSDIEANIPKDKYTIQKRRRHLCLGSILVEQLPYEQVICVMIKRSSLKSSLTS